MLNSGVKHLSGIWMFRSKDVSIMVMGDSWMLKKLTDENAGWTRYGQNTPPFTSLTCCAQDFERKSALFVSSEILIVNLWEHQVGLYQGANMGLLNTIFEVNLGLFGKKSINGYVPNHYFLLKLVFERDL